MVLPDISEKIVDIPADVSTGCLDSSNDLKKHNFNMQNIRQSNDLLPEE